MIEKDLTEFKINKERVIMRLNNIKRRVKKNNEKGKSHLY